MVIEFGGLEVDLSGVRDAIAGGGKESPSTYTVDSAAHDPPPGYPVGSSRHGGIEIAFPRIPVRKALLPLALFLLLLAWPVGWLHKGHSVFALIGALYVAYCLAKLAAGVLVQTSWVVADHWLLRRRVLWGLPAWEAEFAVELIEIDNAQWKTGRGSTDTLRLRTRYGEQVKVYSTNDEIVRLLPELWLVPEAGRGPITAHVLQLGEFLAHHANVQLEVIVRQVREPSSD
jgi:hypothetical protein